MINAEDPVCCLTDQTAASQINQINQINSNLSVSSELV